MTFSDMVFGFGYLLLWHYSGLPLFIFASVLYLSPIWKDRNLIERKVVIETIRKMICFNLTSMSSLVSLLCNISEISGFYSCALFIIKNNTKSAFSFVWYLLGYWTFWNYDRSFFQFLKVTTSSYIVFLVVTMIQQSAKILQIRYWEALQLFC